MAGLSEKLSEQENNKTPSNPFSTTKMHFILHCMIDLIFHVNHLQMIHMKYQVLFPIKTMKNFVNFVVFHHNPD